MIKYRWISVDEGAHLADGKLILLGKIPFVDYLSRQPLYVFLYAISFKLFGITLLSGRLTSLIMCTLTSMTIFKIGEKLFDKETACAAQTVFILTPFILFFSATANMTNPTLLTECLGILTFIYFIQTSKNRYLLISGMIWGLSYYIRESSLAIFLSLTILAIIISKQKNLSPFNTIAIFSFGIILLFFATLVFYSKYLTLSDIFLSPLNPAFHILTSISKIHLWLIKNEFNTEQITKLVKIAGLNPQISKRELLSVLTMNSFLLIGFLIFLISSITSFIKKKFNNHHLVLLFWILGLFLAYFYFYFIRGFLTHFAMEFIAPLILITSYILNKTIKNLFDAPTFPSFILIFFISWTFFFLSKFFAISFYFIAFFFLIFFFLISLKSVQKIKKKVYFWIADFSALFGLFAISFLIPRMNKIIVLAIIFFVICVSFIFFRRSGLRMNPRIITYLFVLSLLISANAKSFQISGKYLGWNYKAYWKQSLARDVEKILLKYANPRDKLLSGGMIWTINEKIDPYANITHPTTFLSYIEEPIQRTLVRKIDINPPQFIVLDGYTEHCYLFLRPKIESVIHKKYFLIKNISNENVQAKIYMLKSKKLTN